MSLPDFPDGGPATGTGAAWATLLTTSTLLNASPEGHLSGGLAIAWTVSEERDQLELRIRPDALFADGRRIMAEDVVASASHARQLYRESPEAWRWEHVESVEAAPDNVVRVSLSAPDASIPALLASFRLPILPAAWLTRGWDHERGPYPPASGCFQLLSASDDRLRFGRNDGYFQVGRPRLAGVLGNAPAGTMLRTTDLVTNGADLLIDAPLLDVPMLREDPGMTLVGGPTNRLCLLTVNLQNPVMADVRLRRLLASAIDRPALVRGATASEAVPASTLIPPEHWAGLDDMIDLADVEDVRAGLAELGLPPGIELRLVASATDASLANACVLLQEQLAWAGIALSLDLLDASEMRAELAGGRWDLAMSYTGYWRDPHELVRPLVVSDGSRNAGGYANDRVDYLAELARRASDDAYRAGFYQTIQRVVAGDVPVIPLFFPNYYDAMSTRLRDYPFFPPISAAAMHQATMPRPDPVTLP
ncbi:MAG: ABC transporter substrate-binding protein [Chloroflexia bacterium]|nr:ABC transporter substrate-binding protein [Chloroflexia bacterium]